MIYEFIAMLPDCPNIGNELLIIAVKLQTAVYSFKTKILDIKVGVNWFSVNVS